MESALVPWIPLGWLLCSLVPRIMGCALVTVVNMEGKTYQLPTLPGWLVEM